MNVKEYLKSMQPNMFKENKIYIKSADQAPENVNIQEGPKGGLYYEPTGDTNDNKESEPVKKKFPGRSDYTIIPKIKAPKDSYDGFDLQTDVPYYDDLLENPEYYENNKGITGFIVEMTPDEYIDSVAAQQWPGMKRDNPGHFTTLQEYKDYMLKSAIDTKNVNKLLNALNNGEKLPMLVLNYNDNSQEGRHRALAAKAKGIQKIPVLKVYPYEKHNSEENILKNDIVKIVMNNQTVYGTVTGKNNDGSYHVIMSDGKAKDFNSGDIKKVNVKGDD